MNWKALRLGVILAVAANAGLMALTCNEHAPELRTAAYFALLLGLPLVAFVAVVWLLRHDWRFGSATTLALPMATLASLAVWLALILPASYGAEWIGLWRCDRAKAGIDWSVAALDTYKGAHGRYPQTLDEARSDGTPIPVPDMAAATFYRPNPSGQTFELVLASPRPNLEYVYNSNMQEWYDHKKR